MHVKNVKIRGPEHNGRYRTVKVDHFSKNVTDFAYDIQWKPQAYVLDADRIVITAN